MWTYKVLRIAALWTLMIGLVASFGELGEAQTSQSMATSQKTNPAAPADLKQQIRSYFFDAARIGNVAMLEEIIASKYDLNTRDEKGYTALILAAYHGNEGAVKLLMSAGADPCAADDHGNTALMGAIFKGEIGIARQLLNAKCNPNQRNEAGQTAAMYAALFGRLEIMQGLKEQGADLQTEDSDGNSAEKLAHGEFSKRGRD
jgi:ankyrin repeat protein